MGLNVSDLGSSEHFGVSDNSVSSSGDKRKKFRYWGFILYPESAPVGWLDELSDRLIPFAVSPCHDKDVDDDGHLLKPHYHVILAFKGPTTYNNVLTITRSLNATIPISLFSVSGSVDYLTHSNRPNKHQYSAEDIIYRNNFTVESSEGDDDLRMQLISIIVENNILEFYQLIDHLMSVGDKSLLKRAFKESYALNTYLSSLRYSKSVRGG